MNDIVDILNLSTLQQNRSVPISLLQLLTATILMLLLAQTYKKLHAEKEDCHIMMHSMIYIGVIMTGAMMLIASNLVVAIGLFGAVSIVRFRTAVSNPIDMSYIFLCVVVGISCGLGFLLHGIVMTFFVGGIMIFFRKVQFGMSPPTLITCVFTITAKKDFLTPEILQKLEVIFTNEAKALEIKTKKKKVVLKYTQKVSDIREIQKIETLLRPLTLTDPSMELAVTRK